MLTGQKFIYFDAVQYHWALFLVKQMKRLSNDLQFGLQVASCIGESVPESMLHYLSKDLGHDLNIILWQACQEGFMVYIADLKLFYFSHDKIKKAVYEMIPDQQWRKNHMQFGLSLCTRHDEQF